MSFEDALRQASDGVIIDFEVSPGAKATKVPAGYNEWRKRILAKLKAPPERGRANEELINTLAALLGVSPARIEIASGATNAKKSIKIKGMALDEAARLLRGKL